MSAPRDPDVILAAWLDDGPAGPSVLDPPCDLDRRPDDAPVADGPRPARVEAIDVQVHCPHGGRRGRRGRRRRRRHRPAQAFRRDRRNNAVRLTEPEPEPEPSPTPSPTTASPSPSAIRIDTSQWDTYESARYGFTIGHPADWEVVPATRDWTFDADASADVWSPAEEAFINRAGAGIRVSAWSVPIDSPTGAGWGDVEAWVQEYCERTGNSPCTGIHERAVPLCLRADGLPSGTARGVRGRCPSVRPRRRWHADECRRGLVRRVEPGGRGVRRFPEAARGRSSPR